LSAHDGDTNAFTKISYAGDVGYATVLDPYGNQLVSYWIGSSNQATLPTTGPYTLVLQGAVGATQPASYSFVATRNSQNPPPAITGTTITPGTAVSGVVAATGTSNYKFTLTAPTRLFFDSQCQANSYAASWRLLGPQGVVHSRYFIHDDFNLGLLPAGTYSLEVTGTAGEPFTFSLVDFSAATSLSLDAATTATLEPANGMKLYAFPGTAGQLIYLDTTAFSSTDTSGYGGYATYFLLDQFGNQVGTTWNLNGEDSGRVTLPSTGTYTLVLRGHLATNGTTTATFTARNVTGTSSPLTLGTAVTGVGIRNYTFTLASPTRLWFDSRTSNSNPLTWRLVGPQGAVQSDQSFYSGDDNLGLLQAGAYVLEVTGPGDEPFAFNLLDLSAGTALELDASTTAALDPSNASEIYTFTGTAGQVVYFDTTEFSSTDPNGYGSSSTWQVLDQLGNQVGSAWYGGGDSGRLTLPTTGSYTLVLQGHISASGTTTATFTARSVTDTTAAMTPGTTVSGTLAMGQVKQHTFTLSSTTQLLFDGRSSAAGLSWAVTGPQGTLGGQSFSYGDAQLLVPSAVQPSARGLIPAGTYTVSVWGGSGDATDAYSFRVLDLSTATTITRSTVVSGTLPSPDGVSIYKLAAAAGDNYSFTYISSTGDGTYWKLIDPYGNEVFSSSIDTTNRVDLPATGNYTLILQGVVGATQTANHSFVATRNSQTTPPAITGTTVTPGTAVSGTVASSGTSNYKFTLASSKQLWFDSRTNTYSATWKLTGPQGVVVGDRYFAYDDFNLGMLPAGTYSLQVTGTVGEPFAFNLLDFSAATSLTLDTSTTMTVGPASATKLYKLSGTAGQVVYFDTTAFSSTDPNGYGSSSTWQVLDQLGNQVGSAWYGGGDSGR
ncbi:MAG: hypothetical protein ACKOTB_10140, partial [Planctomycetia bacterium]